MTPKFGSCEREGSFMRAQNPEALLAVFFLAFGLGFLAGLYHREEQEHRRAERNMPLLPTTWREEAEIAERFAELCEEWPPETAIQPVRYNRGK